MARFYLTVLACLVVFYTNLPGTYAYDQCGENTVQVDCAVSCSTDRCPRSQEEAKKPCKLPANCSKPGCKCRFNYRRDECGNCIPTRDCPPFDCPGENEEFNPCPPLCSDDCGRGTPTGECKTVGRIGIVWPCLPKCRCVKGYWRLNGTCVPYDCCPTQSTSWKT